MRRLKGIGSVSKSRERFQLLSNSEEKVLVNWIETEYLCGRGPGVKEIMGCVNFFFAAMRMFPKDWNELVPQIRRTA